MLYLIRGLPGSGKSTLAANAFKGILHIENDMFHMDSTGKYDFDDNLRVARAVKCLKLVTKALSMRMTVVVSNVFVTKDSIKRYTNIADSMKHGVKVFRCISQFRNQHDVPKDVLRWMSENFEDYEGEKLIDCSKLDYTTLKLKEIL